jgi:hypothetical protein
MQQRLVQWWVLLRIRVLQRTLPGLRGNDGHLHERHQHSDERLQW